MNINKAIVEKILIILSFMFLVVGCKTNELEQIKPYDDKSEAKYNILTNGFANLLQMGESGEVPLYYANASNIKHGSIIIPMYLKNGTIQSLNTDPSIVCTIDNASECTSFLKSVSTIYVYDDYVYYLEEKYNADINEYECTLMQSYLDLTNQKKLYSFKHTLRKEEISKGWYTEFIQIHKGIIYVLYHDTVYVGNIGESLQPLELEGVEGIKKIFLYDDTLIISADTYDDGKKVYFNTIIESNLVGEINKVLYENITLYFIDENFIFYLNKEEQAIYMMNRKTEIIQKVMDGLCAYYFKTEDFYLLDSIGINSQPRIIILDKNGAVLDEKIIDESTDHVPQMVTNDRIYFKYKDQIGYYKINNDEISNDYYLYE